MNQERVMIVLKEDYDVLTVSLQSYVDGVREEMKQKAYSGKVAEIMQEYLERADRLILRLRSFQKKDNP